MTVPQDLPSDPPVGDVAPDRPPARRPAPAPAPGRIAEAILELTTARGTRKSVCPSEVARALARPAEDAAAWRPLMGPVRAEAVRLAREGRIEVLRKGKPADLDSLRGVIRLRIVPGDPG